MWTTDNKVHLQEMAFFDLKWKGTFNLQTCRCDDVDEYAKSSEHQCPALRDSTAELVESKVDEDFCRHLYGCVNEVGQVQIKPKASDV